LFHSHLSAKSGRQQVRAGEPTGTYRDLQTPLRRAIVVATRHGKGEFACSELSENSSAPFNMTVI